MSKLKVAVMYYSSTSANYKISKWAAEAAEAAGAEVKRLMFQELAPRAAIESNEAWKKFTDEVAVNETNPTLDDLEWADALIFSIPTRYGALPSQVQSFFDTTGGLWMQGKLANKTITAMTSAMNPHGGQESTLQALYKIMAHWGSIVIPPGYTSDEVFAAGGNPLGTSTAVDMEGNIQNEEVIKAAVQYQVKRMLSFAEKMA